MAEIFIPPYIQLLSSNAEAPELLGSSKLYFYDVGTESTRTVYQDSDLETAHAQPVVANSAGRFAPIYLPVGDYKVVHKDSAGSTIWTADNVPGKAAAADDVISALPDTPVLSKTSDYTVLAADMGAIIYADPTGAAIAITLISAVTAGDGAHITVKHAGTANNVTIATVSAQTIDGVTSWVLKERYSFITLVSNGANWLMKDHAYGNAVLSLFQQTAAPSGWTKATSHNDKALRVVSGSASSGGSTAFSSIFAARTILTANLPAHSHTGTTGNQNASHTHSYGEQTDSGSGSFNGLVSSGGSGTAASGTESANHQHVFTTDNTGSGTAMDFAVHYVDVILASKGL
jgi:hypothetical protein